MLRSSPARAVAVSFARAGTSTAGAGAFGASFAVNNLGESGNDNKVWAEIDTSDVTAGGAISVEADMAAGIFSVGIGFALGFANSTAGSAIGVAGAGSVGLNKVRNSTQAGVRGVSRITTVAGGGAGVSVTASDDSWINATAGAAAVSIAMTQGSAGAIGLGFSLTKNTIANTTAAAVEDATMASDGTVIVSADNRARIDSLSFGIAVGVAASEGTSWSVNATGAFSVNEITDAVQATITSSDVGNASGSIQVAATDSAHINAKALGATVSVASGANSFTLALTVTSAHNNITSDTRAEISNATVRSFLDTIVTATSTRSVNAVAAAASVAVPIGVTVAVSLSGAGAEAINVMLGDTNADLLNSSVASSRDVTLTASDASAIEAVVVAVSGGAASVGAAVANNFIGYHSDGSRDASQVWAYGQDSTINATRNLTLTADSKGSITAQVGAGSVGVAMGPAVSVSFSGAGVSTENKVARLVYAYLDGAVRTSASAPTGIRAATVELNAADTTTITALAGAASLAASYAGTGPGVSVSIGVALAANTVSNEVLAYVNKVRAGLSSTSAANGDIWVHAASGAKITSTAAAASLAVAVGNFGAGISGAGAHAQNIINTQTLATIEDSKVTSARDVKLEADNTGLEIKAEVVAASAAVGVGATGGLGISIGAALAENFIGYTSGGEREPAEVQAYIKDSVVTATRTLTLTATSTAKIDSTVAAGSAAIAGSSGSGAVGLSGAGVNSKNQVAVLVQAYLDGDSTTGVPATGIRATQVDIRATDNSSITALAGAASLAASFAGGTGVAVTIGVGLAHNVISNEVAAYIQNVSHDGLITSGANTGDVGLVADSHATITSTAAAASLGVALSGSFSVSLSGAGAEAKNVIRTKTNAFIKDSKITAARDVTIKAVQQSAITATVAAVSLSVAIGSNGVGASIGAALAHNFIGYSDDGNTRLPAEVQAYVSNSNINAQGSLLQSATSTATIAATVLSGSVALVGGYGLTVSASGAGASTENQVATLLAAYIAGRSQVQAAAVTLRAEDKSTITADTGAASIAAAVGSLSATVSVGEGQASNTIANQVAAYITGASNVSTSSGDIALHASEHATIRATAIAASIAASVGEVSLAVSGAGADAKNSILGNPAAPNTQAYVSGSTLTSGHDISLRAIDQSTIDARIQSDAAAAAAGGGAFGAAIGSSTAENSIGYAANGSGHPVQVLAFITDSIATAQAAIDLEAKETATITADVAAISAAFAVGAVGAGTASGAGVNVINRIATVVNTTISNSPGITTQNGGVSLNAADTSTVTANGEAASIAGLFAPSGFAFTVGVALSENTITNTVAAEVSRATISTTGGGLTVAATEHARATGYSAAAAGGAGKCRAGRRRGERAGDGHRHHPRGDRS